MAPQQDSPQAGLSRVNSGTPHYQTFPTQPPPGRGKPPANEPPRSSSSRSHDSRGGSRPSSKHDHHASPLPKRQLFVLALIALAEQTALNSFPPYLPDMVSTFPEVQPENVGVYVGLVASSFALAQFATNFFWGWLSDRIGRKPVILIGTVLTAASVLAFGFCRTLWQAIVVQLVMGLVNGNQGVVSTCLGEITDRSNQSRAFLYLPVVYGLGGITGPIVGGLLVNRSDEAGATPGFPYLVPNIVSAALLLIELVVTMIFLEESLEELKDESPLGHRLRNLFVYLWEFTGFGSRPSRHPSFLGTRASSEDSGAESADEPIDSGILHTVDGGHLTYSDVFNRDVILILITFFIFQLSNIAYNSLYPIFGQAKQPTGRNLSPEEIGVSLAFAGLITIVFQVGVFGKLRDKIGNRTTYRIGLGGFVISFLLMPWVGYKDSAGGVINEGKAVLWTELGVVLVIKTVAAVGGLTSALLLVRSIPLQNLVSTDEGMADHELGTGPHDSRYAEWTCADALGRRTCRGPVSIGQSVLTGDTAAHKGRGYGIRRVWRRVVHRLLAELPDPRREAGGRRVGRGGRQRGRRGRRGRRERLGGRAELV